MSYKVRFVDLSTQYHRIESEIIEEVKRVMSAGDFILRDDLLRFENNMASLLGVKHVVGVGSGTDALYLSLKAAGIGSNDEVITVAFTCMATIAVIVHCGAKPILVDVSEDYNIDVGLIEEAITPQTKAILPVHLNGRLCNMRRLMDIASKHNLIVIEDAAQALEASFEGQKAGTFGLASCFSLYPMKILGGGGDGGFVATNDEALAEKVYRLRDLGQQRTTGDVLCFGFNTRLDNLQAAILNVKLKYVPQWIARRREVAALYHGGLSRLQELKLPPSPQPRGDFFDVFQNYVIRAKERDRLVAHLDKCGIEVLVSWYLSKPLHYHEALNLRHFHLPNTEQFAQEAMSLPLNSEISNEQVQFVIEAIHEFYNGESE
jgi:dTDP-4-amino-4,6-dideoxygalactose transaminase